MKIPTFLHILHLFVLISITAITIFTFLLPPGPTSFQDVRTITNASGQREVLDTYQQACIHLGLTYNDDAARKAMRDAYNYIQNDRLIKTFFVNLCLYQFAADPWAIFQEFKVELCSRACHKKNVDVNAPTDEIINDVLLELKELFEKQSANMEDYITAANMPTPKPKGAKDLLIETNFDPEILAEIASTNEKLLNEEQLILINTILKAIDSPEGGLFSAEASGGTGKTFCFKTLLAKLRSEGKIAVAMATSGSAATFFDGGRTVCYYF